MTEIPQHIDFETRVYPVDYPVARTWKELWDYRDLIFLLVRRTFVSRYKQTVLGPAWAIIQPLFSTGVSAIVFGNLAGLSPSGVPTFLFYFIGQSLWALFSTSVNIVANTFSSNAHIMGKVYFPRFAMPISGVLGCLIDFLIQMLLFILFYLYYLFTGTLITPNPDIVLLPLYVVHLLILALGIGAILSAFTTKYYDVRILISFGLTLWMYITPVLYDLNTIPANLQKLYLLNPVTPIILHIRSAMLGMPNYRWGYYLLSLGVSIVLLLVGYRAFNHAERTFVDTI